MQSLWFAVLDRLYAAVNTWEEQAAHIADAIVGRVHQDDLKVLVGRVLQGNSELSRGKQFRPTTGPVLVLVGVHCSTC